MIEAKIAHKKATLAVEEQLQAKNSKEKKTRSFLDKQPIRKMRSTYISNNLVL